MKKSFYSFVKTSLGASLFSWAIAHMSFLIPSDRLYETEILVAFHHPSPSYSTHILIVPKDKIRSLMDLNPQDSQLMQELIQCVQVLVKKLGLENHGYRLVVNGGKAQEVGHLHFHLISDDVHENQA